MTIRWGWVVLAVLAATSCSPCPRTCPATWASITITITDSARAAVSGVEATVAGASLSCQGTLCTWPPSAPVTAGSYSVHVTAPGFKDATIAASLVTDEACGCTAATLTPATFTLERL